MTVATKTTPDPGIYQGVPFSEYKAWPALNHSTLKHGLRSMAHVKSAMEHPTEATPAMRIGRIVHAAALEPLRMIGRFAVLPPFENEVRRPDGSEYTSPKASRAYKTMVDEWRDDHPNTEIVTEAELGILEGVVASLQANSRAGNWLWSAAKAEVSITWIDTETGVQCKSRLDVLDSTEATVTDLKTTADGQRFETQLARLGYHRQLGMYAEGMRVLTGREHTARIIAVETKPPFGVRAAPLSDDALQWGRESFRRLLRQFADCVARDEWPGYESPDHWNLPTWATADALNDDVVELIVGGQAVGVQ